MKTIPSKKTYRFWPRQTASGKQPLILGSGAFAHVLLGMQEIDGQPGTGRRIAIKILRPELSLQPVLKQRFLNEARATNIVRCTSYEQ